MKVAIGIGKSANAMRAVRLRKGAWVLLKEVLRSIPD